MSLINLNGNRLGIVGVAPAVPFERKNRDTTPSLPLCRVEGRPPLSPSVPLQGRGVRSEPTSQAPLGEGAVDDTVPCVAYCDESTNPWTTFTERIVLPECAFAAQCFVDVTVSTRTSCSNSCEVHIHQWERPVDSQCPDCPPFGPNTDPRRVEVTAESVIPEILKYAVRHWFKERQCRPDFLDCRDVLQVTMGACGRYSDGSSGKIMKGWYPCDAKLCCYAKYEICWVAKELNSSKIFTLEQTRKEGPSAACDTRDCVNTCFALPDRIERFSDVGP